MPESSRLSGLQQRRLAWLVLAAIVCLPYLVSLDGPFVYDDKVEVSGNRAIRVFENWRAVLGYNISRPLLVLSYAFDWQRAGLDPRSYHITSLFLHVLTLGGAIFLADALGRLFGLTRPLLRATLATALWALHPMGAESVAYVTGRSEVLCAGFVFLSLGAHVEALLAERRGGWSVGWRALALVGFAAGALSKEVAVMVPFAQVVLEMAAGGSWRKVRWLGFLPVAMLVTGAAGLRWSTLPEGATLAELIPHEVERSLAEQLTTSAEVWLHYARLWVLPLGQTLFHDQPVVSPSEIRGLGAIAGWGLMVAGAGLVYRRSPLAGALLACAGLFLIPSTSIARLKEPMAEHRAYQTGFYLLFAAISVIPDRWGADRRVQGAACALLVALGLSTAYRASVWSSEVSLWREAVARTPDSADAWFGLGDAHRFASDCTAAAPAYSRALELADSGRRVSVARRLDAMNNLGICRAQLGDATAARRAWLRALELRPSYCRAHTNLGSLAYRQRNWEAAMVELRSALAYCPNNPTAHWLVGNLYYGPLRDPQKALVHYQALVQIAPQFDFAPEAKERILELTW